jgi:hypothetical protein
MKTLPKLIYLPFTALALVCFALLPSVQAAPDPAPPPGNNTRDGAGAMFSITSGLGNTALGTNALNKLTTGDSNAAQGASALFSCTDGNSNTGIGNAALRFLTLGDQTVAIGNTSLQAVTTGSRNTAIGYATLRNQTTVGDNVAVGWSALINNTGGTPNVAIGTQALQANTVGFNNNAVGYQALFSNTGAAYNNAHGTFALSDNTTGAQNNAFGDQALISNVTGSFNTAMGDCAGLSITGSRNIDIGDDVTGVGGESNVTRIGQATGANAQTACYVGGINGVVVTGAPVIVSTSGQLGVAASSARFKTQIKPMDNASEAILALKPVTFHYKSDSTGTPQFGLIAEDVAKVNPDLIVRDADGQIYTVRYEAVNAMLLNEFLKEHQKVENLTKDFRATVAQQQKEIQALTARLEEQAAQIQKVSAQLEVTKPAPQIAVNDQ